MSYAVGSERAVAAAVAVDLAAGRVLDEAVVAADVTVPYEPGRLALREAPLVLAALEQLRLPVDLVLCDGQGIAHPDRFGLACHVGVSAGLAAIGCAKSWLVGQHDPVGPVRGDRAALVDGTDLVGYALRTQDGVRPVFVSPGHRIGADRACDVVLAACSRYRLPDPIRRADQLSRAELKHIA